MVGRLPRRRRRTGVGEFRKNSLQHAVTTVRPRRSRHLAQCGDERLRNQSSVQVQRIGGRASHRQRGSRFEKQMPCLLVGRALVFGGWSSHDTGPLGIAQRDPLSIWPVYRSVPGRVPGRGIGAARRDLRAVRPVPTRQHSIELRVEDDGAITMPERHIAGRSSAAGRASPTGAGLPVHGPEHLTAVAAELNDRPRECSAGDAPAEHSR